MIWLVVSNMTFIFHSNMHVILPIAELHHFFKWVKSPPTSDVWPPIFGDDPSVKWRGMECHPGEAEQRSGSSRKKGALN
jgi:hypothetical protein